MIELAIVGPPNSGKTTLAKELFRQGMSVHVSEDAVAQDPRAHEEARRLFADVADRDLASCVRHTDDLIHLGWSEASEAASLWFDDPGVRIVEGVAVLRAIRKWLARNANGAPCAKLLYLRTPHLPLKGGQKGMATSIENLFWDLRAELESRGVDVEERGE